MSDESTEQRGHPKALAGDLQQLSVLLLEAEPVFVLDVQGRILEINVAAQETFGLNRRQLVGQPFATLVPPKRHEQIEDLLSRCLAGESIRNVESARQNLTGQVNPVSLTLGSVVGIVGLLGHRHRREPGHQHDREHESRGLEQSIHAFSPPPTLEVGRETLMYVG